ncbi:hypothetical protein PTKIN_Ptkin05aG0179500 [Pterospermum kingtungense]
MDSWLVAAAAAAGYFAKYWQNLSRDRNDFPEFCSVVSRTGKAETRKGPFHKFAWKRKSWEDVSSEGRAAAELDSTSRFDGGKVGSLGNHTHQSVISLSNLEPGFMTNENLGEDQCGNRSSADCGGNSAKPSIARMDSFNEPKRKISYLKTRYSYRNLLKPLSSLDGCLTAQLYMQHVKMEEYLLSSLPSPSKLILRRPLLITDGSQIISGSSGDFSSGSNGTRDIKLHNEATFEKSGYVFGIPPLPKIESLDRPMKLKFKKENGCNGRLSIPCKGDAEKLFHSQWGSLDGAVMFCIGISIGIISSQMGNRREVEKLRGLLKQTENLVQDLQEELEMKDSLTVKEIANENYESQETCDNSFHDRATNSSSLEQNMDNSTRYYGKEPYYEKVEERSESMSKIEAELEAELERLGLNMNVSNLERRLSALNELDPEFVADYAEGELRSDMVKGQAVQSASNEDRSGTSTTHSGNYAVSPRELSLLLHKVIQSRLEERVQELETALQNSQRKLKLMESEHPNSQKISYSEWKHSSTLERPQPQINEELDSMSKPLIMKLSGEALDAYNEACEELSKVDESDEDDVPSAIYRNNKQEELQIFDGNMSRDSQNGVNGSPTNPTRYAKNTSEGRTWEEQHSRVEELLDVGVSEDEYSDDCDDEVEKQLIQQILEKTKKGSPVLLNAQRILFSMDEI